MYHQFQMPGLSTPSQQGDPGRAGRAGSTKRVAISNACVECRRRKIRCDGAKPCSQCEYYGETCAYSRPKPRVHLSNKVIETLQAERNRYHTVVSRLFHGQDVDTLVTLSRAQLVEIALRPAAVSSPSSSDDSDEQPRPEPTSKSGSEESLEALDQPPVEHDEVTRHRMRIDGIADDINGLSFSVDRPSSYVGVSSITAALKVIFKTAPLAGEILSVDRDDDSPSSAFPRDEPDPFQLPHPGHGQMLVDSYFAHVHPLMPMIDEDDFQETYRASKRRDTAWLALLNMVFALGSVAGATCTNREHITYYQRSRKHLDLEAFGSGSIDVLRALALMGGYYLHWLNRPNEANGIMGATLRMALALGLHREFSHTSSSRRRVDGERDDGHNSGIPDDVRRKTWWSLFCLDSWASIPTGRPTLGRSGLGIMVESPRDPLLSDPGSPPTPQLLRLLPIVYNTSLCRIATRVQDFLAVSPLIKHDILVSLDAQLDKWHAALPSILTYPRSSRRRSRNRSRSSSGSAGSPQSKATAHDECPDVIRTPRAVMHWRYHNVRILLHRPFLLAAALRKTPFAGLSLEEQTSVARCQDVARETLAHIERNLADDLVLGWNAVWLAYQAVMVPLVSLFATLASPSSGLSTTTGSPEMNEDGSHHGGKDGDVADWTQQIQGAIRIFDRMESFSVAAKKSKDVVQRLLNASQMIAQQYQLPRSYPDPGIPSDHSYLDPGMYRHVSPAQGQQQPVQHHPHPHVLPTEPQPQPHSSPGFLPTIVIPSQNTATTITPDYRGYPAAYDPTTWPHFSLPHLGSMAPDDDSMRYSLGALEWDDSVPPGDMNNLMDIYESTASQTQQHQQHAGNPAGAMEWGAAAGGWAGGGGYPHS